MSDTAPEHYDAAQAILGQYARRMATALTQAHLDAASETERADQAEAAVAQARGQIRTMAEALQQAEQARLDAQEKAARLAEELDAERARARKRQRRATASNGHAEAIGDPQHEVEALARQEPEDDAALVRATYAELHGGAGEAIETPVAE